MLSWEKIRSDKLQYCGTLLQKSFTAYHGNTYEAMPNFTEAMEQYLAEMPVVQDSRWKPMTEISFEPLGDHIRLDAAWDVEEHKDFPTLQDNPSAAAVIESMPEMSSLNLLVDHITMVDFGKPQFHQPTREPIRRAMLDALKKEAEQVGLKLEDLDFYYVIGANRSAHICLPSSIVDRALNRMHNSLGLRKASDAGKVARVANWADIRLKKIKSQAELNKIMTKADRTTDNFRIGSDMLKTMANLGQFDLVIALDLEAWEFDNARITELGFTVYEPASNKLTPYHYIIQENAHHKNGSLVPDHRDRFITGNSIHSSLLDAFNVLSGLMSQGYVALVGHGIQSDLNMILDSGLPKLPSERVVQIDTQMLFLQIDRAADQSRLEDVLKHFKIPHRFLHNAGNDAFYTMMVVLRIAGIDLEPFLALDTYQ